jgi:hypothetical protein
MSATKRYTINKIWKTANSFQISAQAFIQQMWIFWCSVHQVCFHVHKIKELQICKRIMAGTVHIKRQ